MLPPGHLAAGYLAAKTLIALTKPDLDPAQINQLIYLGVFCSLALDLDVFYLFIKNHCLTIKNCERNHRNFITHTPLAWLAIGLIIFLLAKDTFIKYVGVMIWLSSWTHFVLDSFDKGIRWPYPLGHKTPIADTRKLDGAGGFFGYWLNFVKYYIIEHKLIFSLEVALVIAAIFI